MKRLTFPLLCECLLLIIPLNIYTIGNDLAHGIQWALFRYQQSSMGNSLILAYKDILYITHGLLKGSSAYSAAVWVLGAILLVLAVILMAVAYVNERNRYVTYAGFLTIASSVLFFIAEIVQYGPMLANDHGSAIPAGVPLVLIVGIWLVKCGLDPESGTL